MQCSGPNIRTFSRRMRRAACVAALGSLLSGCLPGVPGIGWGDDGEDNAPPSNTQAAPALNRDYKSNFLSLQMPSLGVSNVQAHLMPDIGPVLSAFSTVETRKPAIAGIPGPFLATTERRNSSLDARIPFKDTPGYPPREVPRRMPRAPGWQAPHPPPLLPPPAGDRRW